MSTWSSPDCEAPAQATTVGSPPRIDFRPAPKHCSPLTATGICTIMPGPCFGRRHNTADFTMSLSDPFWRHAGRPLTCRDLSVFSLPSLFDENTRVVSLLLLLVIFHTKGTKRLSTRLRGSSRKVTSTTHTAHGNTFMGTKGVPKVLRCFPCVAT